MPIVVASLIGAAAMIGARCLNVRQAARAFDLKLYLLIGSAFALGTMEATGGAGVLAWALCGLLEPLATTALVSALFFLVMVLTNVLSNNATAILFTPIAVTAANSVGADPTLFALDRAVRRQHLFCNADRLSDQSAGHGAWQVPVCGLHPRRRAPRRSDLACLHRFGRHQFRDGLAQVRMSGLPLAFERMLDSPVCAPSIALLPDGSYCLPLSGRPDGAEDVHAR
jgi:hypothetical protein